ncbi:MAG: sigma-70 family RNA polymerase sigma factor [Planctomycetaceae bacterium]
MPRPKRRNAAAFDEIVQTHRHAVYGYLRARLADGAEATRLTETAFEKFYVDPSNCSDDAIRPRLLTLAKAALSEHARASHGRHDVAWTTLCLDVEESGQEDSDDEFVRLSACLDSLEPAERDAIELKYRADWTLLQIGERLRRSENAARLLLLRARQSLRASLRS